MDKARARKAGLKARALLSEEERKKRSADITAIVVSCLRPGMTVGCYVSMRDEVDTFGILEYCLQDKIRVAVPKVIGNTLEFKLIESLEDLAPGLFGVKEPIQGQTIPVEEIDWMLVPLSSFDNALHRTGYGKGYYDSVLSRSRHNTGLAFSVQRMDEIEVEPHDVALDDIITA